MRPGRANSHRGSGHIVCDEFRRDPLAFRLIAGWCSLFAVSLSAIPSRPNLLLGGEVAVDVGDEVGGCFVVEADCSCWAGFDDDVVGNGGAGAVVEV